MPEELAKPSGVFSVFNADNHYWYDPDTGGDYYDDYAYRNPNAKQNKSGVIYDSPSDTLWQGTYNKEQCNGKYALPADYRIELYNIISKTSLPPSFRKAVFAKLKDICFVKTNKAGKKTMLPTYRPSTVGKLYSELQDLIHKDLEEYMYVNRVSSRARETYKDLATGMCDTITYTILDNSLPVRSILDSKWDARYEPHNTSKFKETWGFSERESDLEQQVIRAISVGDDDWGSNHIVSNNTDEKTVDGSPDLTEHDNDIIGHRLSEAGMEQVSKYSSRERPRGSEGKQIFMDKGKVFVRSLNKLYKGIKNKVESLSNCEIPKDFEGMKSSVKPLLNGIVKFAETVAEFDDLRRQCGCSKNWVTLAKNGSNQQ